METPVNERILRYLLGEMRPEERTDFERRMGEDAALVRAVESCRRAIEAGVEWFDAETPGVECADSVEIPPLASVGRRTTADRAASRSVRAARVVWLRPVLVRALAAAAVFVAGVLVGALVAAPGQRDRTDRTDRSDRTGRSQPVARADRTPVAPAQVSPAPERPTQTATQAAAQPTPIPRGKTAPPAKGVVRYAQTLGDRVVIETALADSGNNRAVWVVDGSFRLNGSER